MQQPILLAVLGLLHATAAEIYPLEDEWPALLRSPRAQATRDIKGYNVSQAYPGEELDGWKAYVKIRDQLPLGGEHVEDYTGLLTWIGITPPKDIERTGGDEDESQYIEADDSWKTCLSGFAFRSSVESVDADCGNVLSDCMEVVKEMAKNGNFCQAADDLHWQRTEDALVECNFEEGIREWFRPDNSSFKLSNRTVAGMNLWGPWTLVEGDDSTWSNYKVMSEMVYFVSADWMRNGNGTGGRSGGGSGQAASSYACMRPDTFSDEEDRDGAASTSGISLLMVMGFAVAASMF